jgi:hypothetical protein
MALSSSSSSAGALVKPQYGVKTPKAAKPPVSKAPHPAPKKGK